MSQALQVYTSLWGAAPGWEPGTSGLAVWLLLKLPVLALNCAVADISTSATGPDSSILVLILHTSGAMLGLQMYLDYMMGGERSLVSYACAAVQG